MKTYNHSCVSVALDSDNDNWILLDFSSLRNADESCELLNNASSCTIFSIDYEGDFVNTTNRILPNTMNFNKHFIGYIRRNRKLSTSDIINIYHKLMLAVEKVNMETKWIFERHVNREKIFKNCLTN